MISICLLGLIRYAMSHGHKKVKNQDWEDEQRIVTSAASIYQASVFGRPLPVGVDLDLPEAFSLENRPNYY
uniref:Uncharacterized protein n=1 Tax=Panagrolaimus sp. PS1159 TaxID=55785 RepID=A0AC35GYV0_9BILA